MGLLRAGVGALGGVLADQWREYFHCESLDADILVAKGENRTTKRSSNTKGNQNIISNGSIIAVNEGQCMMIVEQGKVVEICAEPGEFVYDASTEPSIFYGGLGANIKDTFKNIGKRFTFGGDPPKDQRVYYFNTKEIVGNKYGTVNPVPFRVVDKNIGLDIDISIRCNGEYSYKIVDPLLFYTNVTGNVEDEYDRNNIDSMLKTELLTALQPVFAKISDMGIRYSSLPGHTTEISNLLNEVLSEKWTQLRGLAIASFGINSVNASKEDEDLIKQLQKSAVMRDPTMAGATLVGAQADAMRAAAANEGGAMTGFMGLGMAQGIGGGVNASNLFQMGQNNQDGNPQQTGNTQGGVVGTKGGAQSDNSWSCSCGKSNTGKFCNECGKEKPLPPNQWSCSCGHTNTGKFCNECGKPMPEAPSGWSCSCGHINTGKFCNECGKEKP